MITVLHRASDVHTFEKVAHSELERLVDAGGLLWVDVIGRRPDEVHALAETFGLDHLVVEDILDETHYPKVDEFEEYLFVVLHGIAEVDGRLGTAEMDAIVGYSYLVTFRSEHTASVSALMQRLEDGGLPAGVGPDGILARLSELQGRRFLPVVTELDLAIDDLEDRAIAGDPDVVAEIQALRGDAARLRRVVGPLRDTLQELSSPVGDVIGREARDRFASVFDHHYRLVESLDAARTMLGAVLDTYRSTVAERMNEVMKVLTVYTAILLPLSLMAGIYGMNFSNMPELAWRNAYFVLLGLMAVIAIGQWVYFVRRGFIGRFRPERAARRLGGGLVRVARLPFDAASYVVREVGVTTTRRQGRSTPDE